MIAVTSDLLTLNIQIAIAYHSDEMQVLEKRIAKLSRIMSK